ncbi:MAG: TetR/AcrR family transcriptional regulator [Thermodesulfobacteriota bacterium]
MENFLLIKSKIKDKTLINKKRGHIANKSVELFVKKGYHQTTVREIAKASGMSMGALYDYISTKEDILFLVCDHIHSTVNNKLRSSFTVEKNSLQYLKDAIKEYYTIIDEIQDYMLLLYQETKSLNKNARKYIFNAELELTIIFENILKQCIREKTISLKNKDTTLVAHNIMVTGQMWAFRRWAISRDISLKIYIERQTEMIFKGII